MPIEKFPSPWVCGEMCFHDQERWRDKIHGEWDGEANKYCFIHNGMPCVVHRARQGHLCGYVGIPVPWEMELDSGDLDVHGGVTWDDVYDGYRWVGFDCAHAYDLVPEYEMVSEIEALERLRAHLPKTEYRNIDYVIQQTRKLADQIAKKREAQRGKQ